MAQPRHSFWYAIGSLLAVVALCIVGVELAILSLKSGPWWPFHEDGRWHVLEQQAEKTAEDWKAIALAWKDTASKWEEAYNSATQRADVARLTAAAPTTVALIMPHPWLPRHETITFTARLLHRQIECDTWTGVCK